MMNKRFLVLLLTLMGLALVGCEVDGQFVNPCDFEGMCDDDDDDANDPGDDDDDGSLRLREVEVRLPASYDEAFLYLANETRVDWSQWPYDYGQDTPNAAAAEDTDTLIGHIEAEREDLIPFNGRADGFPGEWFGNNTYSCDRLRHVRVDGEDVKWASRTNGDGSGRDCYFYMP